MRRSASEERSGSSGAYIGIWRSDAPRRSVSAPSRSAADKLTRKAFSVDELGRVVPPIPSTNIAIGTDRNGGPAAAAYRSGGCVPMPPTGSATVNVEPWPGRDETETVPPCSAAVWWTMANPNPDPSRERASGER